MFDTGAHLSYISPEIVAEVKSRAPQVTVAEVAHSDHHITLDNPQGFVQVVNAFLHKNNSQLALRKVAIMSAMFCTR